MVGCLLSVSMLRTGPQLLSSAHAASFDVSELSSFWAVIIALATSRKRDEARPRHAQRRETVLL